MATTKIKPAPDLASVRGQITELQRQRDEVQTAPLAHETIRGAVRRQFDQAAASYVASLTRMLRFPHRHEGVRLRTPTGAGGSVDMTPLLAAVFGTDTLLKALEPHISAAPDGPTEEYRAEQLATIEEDLFRLEVLEEDLIEASGAAGAPIARRGNARPEIVLRVA